MTVIVLILLILAGVLFLLATFNVPAPFNLVAAGLLASVVAVIADLMPAGIH